ncbi:HlyD family secretion protein [Prochlorococcus marinus]|uniref:HlyD family secretion protein n=1 Tax=Prochlorococcus marinus TaxID=1219 RepID=UPI0022B3EA7B|nr:HlyD family efflux transporter periplasmic adaptor subunit [Prochlorococcus marinus]
MKKEINKNDGSVNQSKKDATTKRDFINQTKSVLTWIEKKLNSRESDKSKVKIMKQEIKQIDSSESHSETDKTRRKDYLNQTKSAIAWIEKKLTSRSSEETILSQSQYWTRAITWSLIGTTAFGVGWLFIAKTEEIVIATGKLEPIKGVVDVQMPLKGVAKEILVKEGDIVKEGQLLIRLDSEITNSQFASIQQRYELNKNILNRMEKLVDEGAVAEIQYLEQKNKMIDLKSKLTESEVILKYQKILSPVDGRVFDLKPWGPGYVAQSSEPVLKIVPFDNLHAKVEIESRTIGFVSLNKPVDVSVDSYPATDFGVITGKVVKISSDALPPDPRLNKGYRYLANIDLDKQALNTKQGIKLALQPGMSITANIKLRKVSYLQLLLGTFKNKSDSLREIN